MDLPDLVCQNCQNSLSRFPIYSYEEDGYYNFICGRCPLKNDVYLQRQIAYERIAKDTTFPCRHKDDGCKLRLSPEGLEKHEDACKYRLYSCPTLSETNNCTWRGGFQHLYNHFKTAHGTLVFGDNFSSELDMRRSFAENCVVKYNEDLFLVYLEHDVETNIFSYHVRCFTPTSIAESYSFKIMLTSGFDEYLLDTCVIGTEGIGTQLPINDKDNSNFKSVAIGDPVPKFVTCHLTLSKSLSRVSGNEPPCGAIELPECLECPICIEYMRPPIMLCDTGHSFCESCKNKMLVCPTCKVQFRNGRNFALETFTRSVIYPCLYRTHGCDVTLKLDDVKAHELVCNFKPIACFIANCASEIILSKFADHIKSCHAGNFLNGNMITYSLNDIGPAYVYVTIFDENVFFISQRYDGTHYVCAAYLAGPSKDSMKYVFEFNLTGDNFLDVLKVQKSCGLFTNYKNIFLNSSVQLHKNSFENLPDNKISAYVRITERKRIDV